MEWEVPERSTKHQTASCLLLGCPMQGLWAFRHTKVAISIFTLCPDTLASS